MAGDLEVRLELDAHRFFPGDPIVLTLRVRNPTAGTAVLTWPTAQRYDFVVERPGQRLWTWSAGRAFAQVLVDQTLDPHGEAVFPGSLAYCGSGPLPRAGDPDDVTAACFGVGHIRGLSGPNGVSGAERRRPTDLWIVSS